MKKSIRCFTYTPIKITVSYIVIIEFMDTFHIK